MRALLLALLLPLAACGGPSTETGQDPSADEGEGTQPLVQEGVPENLVDDPRNTAMPLDPPPLDPNRTPKVAASPATLKAFPAAFQGRWGLVPNDCQPGRADAKGLMEVGPTSLRFYESRGTAQRFAQSRPDRIETTLAFTGEGQEWTATQALTLIRDGLVLVREERNPPSSLRYTKCPA